MRTRWAFLSVVWLFWATSALAAGTIAPAGGPIGGAITVQEEDGAPSVTGVNTLKFTNGTTTDNGDGSVSITVTGGAGTGTVTNTGGNLTSNAVVLGAGTVDTKVVTGITTDGTSKVTLGVAGSSVGSVDFKNATSGTITLAPTTGALGTSTLTMPASTGTLALTSGNVATATALAADPADCAANNFATSINASGTLTCAQPSISAGVSGLGTGVATFLATPSSANLASALTNETGSGAAVFGTAPTLTGATVTTSLNIPNSNTLPATCAVGDIYMDTDATSGQRLYACQATNTWALQGDGGGGGSSSSGSDDAVQTADGVGGFQDSGCTAVSGVMTCSGGFVAGASGAGVLTMLEGTVVSAGANAGEHNLGIDSSDSRLKSRENGGSLVTYALTADKLSAFAATTSAELRGVLSDESGTGVAVFAGGDVGAATATTPSANDNDTSVATTAYVQSELTAYASDSVTFTNKTYDAEGTGNVLTLPRRIWFPAAGCNNATAGNVWDLPTSNPAVPACKTGTNTQMGVLDFADSSNLSAQLHYALPTTWTGAIDARIKWLTSATSGNVVWQLSTICVADAETDDPAFNTASTVTDAAKGTTLQTNDAAITGVTATGCAAGELMHLKIQRDAAHASDTLAATARLIGVELTIREAL